MTSRAPLPQQAFFAVSSSCSSRSSRPRPDHILRDDAAVRAGTVQVAQSIRSRGYTNVLLEIASEYRHAGFDHRVPRSAEGGACIVLRGAVG